MKRQSLKFFCALVLMTLSLSISANADNLPPYRIGVIIPLTGPVASEGNFVRNGIELALSQLSKEERARIEVVYEDDAFQPSKTVTAYRKLSGEKRLDAVLAIGSPPPLALAPITEKDGTILIAVGASDVAITKGRKYSFIHWVTPQLLGKALTDEIKRKDYKKIAFLISDATGTSADREAALAELTNQGLGDRIVYKDTVPGSQTDYRSILPRLRDRQVDAISLVFFPGALSSFVKQVRSAGIKADLLGMETFEDHNEVKNSDGILIGCQYVNAANPTEPFANDYKARYQEFPGWASANGYDSIRLLAKAALNYGNDAKATANFLSTLKDYEGASGKYSAFSDNRFTLPAALKVVTASGFDEVKH